MRDHHVARRRPRRRRRRTDLDRDRGVEQPEGQQRRRRGRRSTPACAPRPRPSRRRASAGTMASVVRSPARPRSSARAARTSGSIEERVSGSRLRSSEASRHGGRAAVGGVAGLGRGEQRPAQRCRRGAAGAVGREVGAAVAAPALRRPRAARRDQQAGQRGLAARCRAGERLRGVRPRRVEARRGRAPRRPALHDRRRIAEQRSARQAGRQAARGAAQDRPRRAAAARPSATRRAKTRPRAASCWPGGWRRAAPVEATSPQAQRPGERACGPARPPRRRPCGSGRPGATGIGCDARVDAGAAAERGRRSGSAREAARPPRRGRRGRRARPAASCARSPAPRRRGARARRRVIAGHEARRRASSIEHGALAAQGLGEQRHGVGADRERRGVELHELEVGQRRAGPRRHAPGRRRWPRRVGGVRRRGRRGRRSPAPRRRRQVSVGSAPSPRSTPATRAVRRAAVRAACASIDLDRGRAGAPPATRPWHDLGAGGVAAGVHDAAAAVGGLEAEGQSRRRRRGRRARPGATSQSIAPGPAAVDAGDDLRIVQAGAGGLRVGGVERRRVVGADGGGDAALGPGSRPPGPSGPWRDARSRGAAPGASAVGEARHARPPTTMTRSARVARGRSSRLPPHRQHPLDGRAGAVRQLGRRPRPRGSMSRGRAGSWAG